MGSSCTSGRDRGGPGHGDATVLSESPATDDSSRPVLSADTLALEEMPEPSVPGGETILDGLSLAQVVSFRLRQVAHYRQLGLFPDGYDPLSTNSRSIYERLTPGAKWTPAAVYYIANPYSLVVATCANHATPLSVHCGGARTTYRPGRIEQVYRGEGASCWLRKVFEPPYADHPGRVRIVMVNAYDAGYRFAHVDLSRSANLDPDPAEDNIINGVFSQPSFYHQGTRGANNISPEDSRGWIRVSNQDAATRIHVWLWRHRPRLVDTAGDLAYVITVDPRAG